MRQNTKVGGDQRQQVSSKKQEKTTLKNTEWNPTMILIGYNIMIFILFFSAINSFFVHHGWTSELNKKAI